jgi:hypothetical protein
VRDHGRGAGDGAIAGGLTGFAIGFGIGAIAGDAYNHEDCNSCGSWTTTVRAGLVGGAVFGLVFAALGTLIGLAGGHEDRYVVAPP